LNKAVKLLSILINTLWTHRCSTFTKDLPVIKIRVAHLFSVLCSPIMCLYVLGTVLWFQHQDRDKLHHYNYWTDLNPQLWYNTNKMTQCALDTTIRKQTQITLIRHEPSYKQRGGKERTAFRYSLTFLQIGLNLIE
jgi:hypothetical protein